MTCVRASRGARRDSGWALAGAFAASCALAAPRVHAQENPPQEAPPAGTPAQNPPAPRGHLPARVEFSLERGLDARAPDDLASLQIGLIGQVYGQLAFPQGMGVEGTFALRHLRGRYYGHLGPSWMTYFVQNEFVGAAPHLLDLYLQAEPIPELGLRAGQFLLPYSYSFRSNVGQRMFVDDGPAHDYFALGRDAGGMLAGSFLRKTLWYWAAAVIGQPVSLQNSVDVRDGVLVGEVRWTPLGDVPTDESPWGYGDVPGRFGVAISGYYGRLVRNIERYDSLTTGLSALFTGLVREGAVTADAIWAWNRLSGAAEFTVGWLQGLMPVAGPWLPGIEATAQVGVFVWAHVLQLAARFSYLDPNLNVTHNEFFAVEGQLGAYIIASHLAVKLRYAAGHEGNTNIVGVPTGWTHLLTLQAQFFF